MPLRRDRSSLQHRMVAISGFSEAAMKDLKADWRKWSEVERISAALVAFAMSGVVPALLLLNHG